MPGKKQFKEQADEGMMRAFYDLEADLRLGAGVLITTELIRTTRKGVYLISITANGDDKVWQESSQVRYQREWPRSEVATLAGAMYQALTALDLMLGQEMNGAQWVARLDPYGTPQGG